MKKILAIFVTLITFGTTYAQTFQLKSEGRDQNYVNSILGRAKKVTDALNITGTDKGEQVIFSRCRNTSNKRFCITSRINFKISVSCKLGRKLPANIKCKSSCCSSGLLTIDL